MAQTIRVDASAESLQLNWPKRCPRCGAKDGLVSSASRVGQVKSVRPNLMGGLTMRSQVLYLSHPMCRAHDAPNRWANKLLESSPLMSLLRALIYVGALFAATLPIGMIRSGHPGATLADLGAMLFLPILGLVGVAALVWARQNSAVRPLRFDPDVDVIEVRFAVDRYAREFKRANPELTDERATQAPPWYRRQLLWKVVMVVGLLLFIGRLMNR